jgi:serine protease
MRVVMQFLNFGSACNVQSRPGETEDYCLRVVANTGCIPPQDLMAVYDEDNETVRLSWPASLAPGGEYLLRYRRRTTMEWVDVATSNLSVTLQDFTVCDFFDAEIASVCDGTTGSFAATIFNSCSDTNDLDMYPNSWSISPNPALNFVQLGNSGKSPIEVVMVYGLSGQLRIEEAYAGGRIDVSKLPVGIYLFRIRLRNGQTGVKRLIKH